MAKAFARILFLLVFCTGLHARAETVPSAPDQLSHYYISVPKGGLPDFLRYHPMRIPLVSHHRGGPVPGYPENAIETMDNALRYGFGLMEVDVAELSDGTLVLMHDDTLDRTTTGKGGIAAKTWPEIEGLYLRDKEGVTTTFRIPRLDAVLEWAIGRAILTLDIKRETNFAKVAEAVRHMGAEDYSVAITYTLAQAKAFHAIAPEMVLTVTVTDDEDIEALVASGIPNDKIVAWTGTKLLGSDFYTKLHALGWRTMTGTFALDQELAKSGRNTEYLTIYQNGIDVIATDRFWAVQQQIRNPNLFFFVKKQPAHLNR